MTECMPISTPPSRLQARPAGHVGRRGRAGCAVADATTPARRRSRRARSANIWCAGRRADDGGLREQRGGERRGVRARGLVRHGRHAATCDPAGYLFITGPLEGGHQPRRRDHLAVRGRGGAALAPAVRRSSRSRRRDEALQEVVGCVVVAEPGAQRRPRSAHSRSGAAGPAPPVQVAAARRVHDGVPKNATNKLQRIRFAERCSMADLRDGVPTRERHFEATCPPKGAPLRAPRSRCARSASTRDATRPRERAAGRADAPRVVEREVAGEPRSCSTSVRRGGGGGARRGSRTRAAARGARGGRPGYYLLPKHASRCRSIRDHRVPTPRRAAPTATSTRTAAADARREGLRRAALRSSRSIAAVWRVTCSARARPSRSRPTSSRSAATRSWRASSSRRCASSSRSRSRSRSSSRTAPSPTWRRSSSAAASTRTSCSADLEAGEGQGAGAAARAGLTAGKRASTAARGCRRWTRGEQVGGGVGRRPSTQRQAGGCCSCSCCRCACAADPAHHGRGCATRTSGSALMERGVGRLPRAARVALLTKGLASVVFPLAGSRSSGSSSASTRPVATACGARTTCAGGSSTRRHPRPRRFRRVGACSTCTTA